jgi:transposase-like protein
MEQKKIDELASLFAKEMKTGQDLNDLSKMLVKATIEKVLGVELEEHLGYSKNSPEGQHTGNNRNGYSRKTVKTDTGELNLETPRDRNGTFEPEFVKKHQTRLTSFDDRILGAVLDN